MTCLFCGRGPQHGVTVYRLNAKGEAGVWACEQHLRQTDVAPPPEVKDVVAAIKAKGRGRIG